MQDYKSKIARLCAFNVKSDPLLCGFGKLNSDNAADALEGCAEIVRTLALSGMTLCDYIHDMLIFSDSPIIMLQAQKPTDSREAAIESDLDALWAVAEIPFEQVKAELANRHSNAEFLNIPSVENGNLEYVLDYTADYFIDFVQRHGSGMFAKYRAFTFDGELRPIEHIDKIRLSDLKNYEIQRQQVVDNTRCFLAGKPAQNVLLYGDRGTGKSSTVKAILNEFEDLRMVEVSKNDVARLSDLFCKLRTIPLHFIVTIDDLSFAENDDRFGSLKAALEGSLSAKPGNILIYATTNRRKIIRESALDREISGADAIDESMSLADRFGLFITFTKPDKQGYLDIVHKLAGDMSINIPEDNLNASAERFALKHGGRSPRVARQFVDWLCGRISLNLEY